MSEMFTGVTPDQTYHFLRDKALAGADIPDAAYEATQRLDAEYRRNPRAHFQRVIDTARPPAVEHGPAYALITEAGASKDTALVVTLPYCNPIVTDTMDAGFVAYVVEKKNQAASDETAILSKAKGPDGFDSNTWNNGEKHLFLFEIMKALGVRDEAGDTIPVIAVAADCQDYHPQLDRQEKRAMRRGSLDTYVKNVEQILDYEGYGNIHAAGYSQGGSVTHAVLADAYNIDVASATLAEIPTYKSRSIGALMINYLANKPAPKPAPGGNNEEKWTASGPLSRRELEAIQNDSFKTMAQTIAKGAWRAAFALRHASLGADLIAALNAREIFPLTIAWNDTSAITHDIETTLLGPTSAEKPVLDRFRDTGRLRTVKAIGHEAVGAPHLAGESPMYYALMMAESVKWATAINRK